MAPRAPHFLVLFCAQKSTEAIHRVNGQRKGRPGSGPLPCVCILTGCSLLRKHRIGRNPVRGRAPGPGRPLRKSATFQKQCGPRSRVNGQRKGRPGSGLFLGRVQQCGNSVAPVVGLTGKGKGGQALALDLFFFFDTLVLALIFGLLIIGLQLSTKINLLRSF